MRQLGHTDYQGNDIAWEEKALEDYAYAGADEADEQGGGIDFQPTPVLNPLKWLKTGASVLSKLETDAIRPTMVEVLKGYSEYADALITRTNRAHAVCADETAIWGSMTEDEIATLVDGMLIIGQRQKHVALAIRNVVRSWGMLQAGIILFPRFLATLQFYSQNGGIALW